MKQPAVSIMANRRNGTVYTGATSDLVKRVYQHIQCTAGFTARFGCKLLVWYQLRGSMEDAILREKQIEGPLRPNKLALIEAASPAWSDLWDTIAHPLGVTPTPAARPASPPLARNPFHHPA